MAAARRSRSISTTIGPCFRRSCTKTASRTASSGWMRISRISIRSVSRTEISKDRFWQAALTVEGQDRQLLRCDLRRRVHEPAAVLDERLYRLHRCLRQFVQSRYGGLANYFYFRDDAGNIINPRQHITGTDHFKKMSQELRFATPADRPIRALFGAFYQDQKNHIFQDYLVDNLAHGPVGLGLSGHALAYQRSPPGQGLCDIRRSELGYHAPADTHRRPALLQVRQHALWLRGLRCRTKPGFLAYGAGSLPDREWVGSVQ